MKQYIKKALWIIPFVFSLNLSATKYYFLGTSSGTYLADSANWNSKTDGSGTPPNNYNGTTDFRSSADEFDFYGASNLVFDYCALGNAIFTNSGSSITITLNGTISDPGSLLISGSPTFNSGNVTFDFDNAYTSVIYSEPSAGQQIIGSSYYDLIISKVVLPNVVTEKDALSDNLSSKRPPTYPLPPVNSTFWYVIAILP